MSYNSLQQPTAFWTTKSNIAQIGSFFHRIFFFFRILKTKIFAKLCKNANQNINLSRRMILGLSLVLTLLFTSYHSLALTAKTTRNVINGSAPYLTFDGGVTRATNVDELLAITLPDGTRITPSTNTSSATKPIQLQRNNVSSIDIGMVVPTNASSVALNTLIGPPNNYWADDDGDSHVTVTGSLTLSIIDNEGHAVDRQDTFDICNAPYKVILESSGGRLSTLYGVPKHSDFSQSSATYYINPKALPTVCFARPNLIDVWMNSFTLNTWNPDRGFFVQSTDPLHYDRNFPTTGADNLYFYLDISGVDPSTLSWPSVSHSGITVNMKVVPPNPSADDWHSFERRGGLRVTLTGPVATPAQISSSSPGNISRPALPAIFEVVGRDSSGRAVIKYGFRLKQWFVNRGHKEDSAPNQASWCNSIGYSMPRVRDLTNAQCTGGDSWCKGSEGATTPPSPENYYQRQIDSGFFTEWGSLFYYTGSLFAYYNWTSDAMNYYYQFYVDSNTGYISSLPPSIDRFVVCASDLRP
jgi:hypothetical protein